MKRSSGLETLSVFAAIGLAIWSLTLTMPMILHLAILVASGAWIMWMLIRSIAMDSWK